MIKPRVSAAQIPFAPLWMACCVFVLAAFTGCSSSPVSTESETGPAPGAVPSGERETPEIVEIRRPIRLVPRVAAVLPDPGLKFAAVPRKDPGPKASDSLASEPPIPVPEEPVRTTLAEPAPKPAPASKAVKPAAKPAPEAKPVTPETPAKTKAAEKPSEPAPPATGESGSSAPAILPPAPASTVLTAQRAVPEPERSEEAARGGTVELPFKGSGWVYLGETGGREGIKYDSRKFDGSSAVFRFTAEKAGEYLLRFQRQDPVSGEPESLLVKVVVKEPETKTSTPPAIAERMDSSSSGSGMAGEKAAADPASSSGPTAAAGDKTSDAVSGPPTTLTRDLPSSPEELLKMARAELAAVRIASTLEVLDKYISLFPFGSDEAFFIYAKAYEHNTPYRDIKKAYRYYKQIRDEWPRSPFWKDAAERVSYIERHYFDIR